MIIQIGNALNVPEGKILFVPGNHDKDWNALPSGELDTTGVRTAQMYAPLKHDDWIFERVMRQSQHYMLTDPCMAIWEFDDLVVVGYNSSRHDDRNAEIHHGLVKNDSLAWLDTQLSAINMDKVKIFLVHHHPIQYSDHIPDIPDFSIMANAENLLRLLSKYKFDLLLHGHKHIPHFSTQTVDSSFPLIILGAGSFSSVLEWSYNGHSSNQFHLVNIDGRDAETDCICGVLKSWSYHSGHGWQPNVEYDGILHTVGFGTHTTIPVLKRILIPTIKTLIEHSEYVRWSDLVSYDNKLGYLPPECVMHFLREIGDALTVELVGDKPDNAILLVPRGHV